MMSKFSDYQKRASMYYVYHTIQRYMVIVTVTLFHCETSYVLPQTLFHLKYTCYL